MIGYHGEHYVQLLRFTRRLLHTDRKDAARRQALREEVAAAPALAERDWLLRQLTN